MVNIVDIGTECFTDTDAHVISYKGENYYQACDAFVYAHPNGGASFCVKRVGHPGIIHEAYDGIARSEDEPMTNPFDRYLKTGLQHEAQQPEAPLPPQEPFEDLLRALINRTGQEKDSGTPDYILAKYLTRCLDLFNETIQARAEWRDEPIDRIFNYKPEKGVPITIYDEHGKGNAIGEAKLELWPGEVVKHGPVLGVIPIFPPVGPDLPIEQQE